MRRSVIAWITFLILMLIARSSLVWFFLIFISSCFSWIIIFAIISFTFGIIISWCVIVWSSGRSILVLVSITFFFFGFRTGVLRE